MNSGRAGETPNHSYHLIKMRGKLFGQLSRLIYDEAGINITPAKKVMLEGRLHKRLRKLGMASFEEYYAYVSSDRGRAMELPNMIDEVTTNKTDFFREPAHFQYLTDEVLPMLLNTGKFSGTRKIRIWSAGCSTGEEPYTIAMVIKNFLENSMGHAVDFHVLATDISRRVLETASRAVYAEERAAVIPELMRKKFLLKGKKDSAGLVKIAPEIRACVVFRRLNFMDYDFGLREKVDVIFCRNVIIYFNKIVQERLLAKFCECMADGGYIFMGHSETLFGMDLSLEQIAPTIYRKIPERTGGVK